MIFLYLLKIINILVVSVMYLLVLINYKISFGLYIDDLSLMKRAYI